MLRKPGTASSTVHEEERCVSGAVASFVASPKGLAVACITGRLGAAWEQHVPDRPVLRALSDGRPGSRTIPNGDSARASSDEGRLQGVSRYIRSSGCLPGMCWHGSRAGRDGDAGVPSVGPARIWQRTWQPRATWVRARACVAGPGAVSGGGPTGNRLDVLTTTPRSRARRRLPGRPADRHVDRAWLLRPGSRGGELIARVEQPGQPDLQRRHGLRPVPAAVVLQDDRAGAGVGHNVADDRADAGA
jgi:hypothetical protein